MLLLLGHVRLAQPGMQLLLLLTWLRLLTKRALGRLLVKVHARKSVLGEWFVDLGMDEVRRM